MKNTFLKLTIRLIIILFNYSNTLASEYGIIEGTIIDAVTSDKIPFATIELMKDSSSTFIDATTSDTSGRFVFNEVQFGNYLLKISYLGYEKNIVSNVEISPETPSRKISSIKLQPDIKQINEVSITGQKISGVITDNKTIYQIKDEATEIAQSGLELLRLIPDVTVSHFSDEVRLAGRSNILFQVNGRKVDNNYLMQLAPDLIDKIEVINNPGVDFDLEVDAVINIVLKRNFQQGVSGGISLNSSTSGKAYMSKNNANIDYYLNNTRFYVAGRYKLHNYDVETLNERTISNPETSYLHQKTYGEDIGSSLGINYGADWFINKKNTFSIYSSFQPISKNELSTITDNSIISNEINNTNYGTTLTADKNYYYNYSVFYSHNFSKKSHKISFEAYGSNRGNENNSNYFEQEDYETYVYSNIQNQYTENINSYMYLKVHYVYPVTEKVKLSTGYNNYYISRDYEYNNRITGFNDLINYKENRHAGYLNLSSTIKKVNVQTGLRYENSNSNITHLTDTTNRYGYLSPSISVTYKNKKLGAIRGSYRKSIGRPGINQLSPAVYTNDSYTQTKGNPGLSPSIRNKFEIEHRIKLKQSMYVSYKPYLSFTKNGIKKVNYLESDSVLVKQYSNVSNEFEYGINISGSLTLFKAWHITPSFTYYNRNIKALPDYGINSDIGDDSWRMNLSSQLILPKKWIVFLEFNYDAPVISHQYTRHAYYDFIVGFNKKINNKISLSAFAFNPWNNKYVYDKRSYTTEGMSQQISSSIKYDYLLFVKLKYRFKSGKTKKNLNRSFESDEYKKETKGIFE